MKKIFYSALAVILAAGLASCSEEALNTAPTTSVSTDGLYESASTSLTPLNGIYRSMYTAGWSTGGNTHQCFGISAYNLAADVMGEDHIMSAQGSGWFWYDALYNVKGFYTSSSWRPYDLWNAYYTWIANANYIIAAKETMTGSASDINYVVGQAYAIRAYSYFMLAQSFCRTYKGHETDPGVPIYTERTELGTAGKPRGTVEQTYAQINADIDTAIARLSNAHARTHKSHIDLYVANGLWARAALARQDYAQAKTCAEAALKKPGLARVASVSALGAFNNRSVSDVMWAFEVTADQASTYGSFISHMAKDGTYGAIAPQCIDYWLYETGMTDSDMRRAWAERESVVDENNDEVEYFYWQTKFGYQNASTGVADIINMRAEEMILTLAECLVREDKDYSGARSLLKELYDQRYSEARDISGLTDTDNITLDTHSLPVTILDEIILQRRIELWCEGMGRLPDLRRLNLGYARDAKQPAAYEMAPNSPDFIWAIPLEEFNSNPALDLAVDQN